jgi:hypothetical protein
VKQTAWLLAAPKVKRHDGTELKLPARIDGYRGKDGVPNPPMPPVTALHIFEWLMEVGPTDSGAMGRGPIGWSTIRDWQLATFKPLNAWEARLLRRLSVEFLTESHLAEDHTRMAPWSPGPDGIDREAEERQLRAVLG